MVQVTVVDRNSKVHEISGSKGSSMMETIRDSGIPDIEAICGGSCSCATCHIYVEAVWLRKLPSPRDDETALLSDTSNYNENSRLSCQIQLSESLSGIRVQIAPTA
jgi:2Fe-2S ferredoxin